MSWKEQFRDAVKNYINTYHNADATEVTDISDWVHGLSYGGVSCGVDIGYRTASSPMVKTFTYDGHLCDLIEELT